MDLRRKLNLDKLDGLYPGHFNPELSLFTFDSANKTINNDFKDISNEDCKHLAKCPVPQNSIQLIRFRARPPRPSPPSTSDEIKKDIESLVSLLDSLGFPISPIINARQDLRLEIGRHFNRDNKDDEPIFYAGGGRFCAIWINYLHTSSTRVVMVNFMPPEFEANFRLHDLLRMVTMPYYQTCFSHPMFFALTMVHSLQLETMNSYTKGAMSLREIENGFVTVRSASRIETMQRLRDLGRLASRDKYLLTTLHKTLGLARRVHEKLYLKDDRKQDSAMDTPFLWHVDQLDDIVALDIAFLTSISESIANQQAALTGIINMQDGASMKTIAVITMAFLPATFVAALFSMPMLQWNDAQNHIISRQFWIYWAVVIPLTSTVFLVWLGWWYWRSIRREYDEEGSSMLQEFRAWLSATLNRNSSTRMKRDNKEGSSQPLNGVLVKRYLKDFYGAKKPSKRGASRSSYVV